MTRALEFLIDRFERWANAPAEPTDEFLYWAIATVALVVINALLLYMVL